MGTLKSSNNVLIFRELMSSQEAEEFRRLISNKLYQDAYALYQVKAPPRTFFIAILDSSLKILAKACKKGAQAVKAECDHNPFIEDWDILFKRYPKLILQYADRLPWPVKENLLEYEYSLKGSRRNFNPPGPLH